MNLFPSKTGQFIVEKHPGDPRKEIVFWEPLRAKKMSPLEAAAVVLSRMADAARSDKSLDLKAVFQKYDTDGGGSIDQEELVRKYILIIILYHKNITHAHADFLCH